MPAPTNGQELRLFDFGQRTDFSGGRPTETMFQFFDRSAWQSAQCAREVLEAWFGRFPLDKRRDLQPRFRGDDRSHSTTLLELVTHELLGALCENVQVEPWVGGGAPDFSACYEGVKFIVECTVTQQSDREFGALQREKTILEAVNNIDSGPLQLIVEPRAIGDSQPSASRLRRELERWIEPLVDEATSPPELIGILLDSVLEWKWNDWEIHFRVVPVPTPAEGAIGATVQPVKDIVDDNIITRALEKKAEDYRQPQMPYLVVLAQWDAVAEPSVILDVLFGPERWLWGNSRITTQPRQLDGFWGSKSKPRKRHVSTVLYKRSMKDAWSICGERIACDPDTRQVQSVPEWYVVHNPFADKPLPQGLFSFALEYATEMGRMVKVEPTCTVNEILGLPDPWPGEEH